MAGERTVSIKFAGSSTGLDRAVGNASKSVGDFGDAADGMATKTGTATGAFGALLSGFELFGLEGSKAAGILGAAALATDAVSGASDFAALALQSAALAKVKDTVATVAHTVASKTAGAATKTWAGIQWLLNAALLANPLVLIVAGIVLLIGVIVLIATKTDWFQRAWGAAWGWIKSAAVNVWEWLKDLPGKIGNAFSKIKDFVTAPFKAAFNMVADLWNRSIGKLRFSVPDWVPGLGGKSFSLPTLPHLDSGGFVTRSGLAVIHKGETVVPAKAEPLPSGPEVLELHIDLSEQITKVVTVNLREHDRDLRSRAMAGSRRRFV